MTSNSMSHTTTTHNQRLNTNRYIQDIQSKNSQHHSNGKTFCNSFMMKNSLFFFSARGGGTSFLFLFVFFFLSLTSSDAMYKINNTFQWCKKNIFGRDCWQSGPIKYKKGKFKSEKMIRHHHSSLLHFSWYHEISQYIR